MKFARPSPTKASFRRGRQADVDEEEENRRRILSASPSNGMSKMDKIAMAQQRMLLKQSGVRASDVRGANPELEKELDENYIPENFLASQQLVVPDHIRNDPKKYF